MPLQQYHNNLSRWFKLYILDLTYDIPESKLWERHKNLNSPGWTLLHLIVEAELALVKIKPDYLITIKNQNDFAYGSDGNAKSNLNINEIIENFKTAYLELETAVTLQLDKLHETEIQDELLKGVLKTELDFYLHLLTSHIAMHCDALTKWRPASGMKLPYEE